MILKKIKKLDENYLNGRVRGIYNYIMYIIEASKITPIPYKFYYSFGLYSRFEFFKRAQYYLQNNRIDGIYVEFGSHEVNTFRMALRTLGLPRKPNKIKKFYSFDSFEGMPEPEGIDRQKIWKKSMNFTTKEYFLKTVKKDSERVVAVKGFYDNVLPNYNFSPDEKIALTYIDCDYYTSTKECLNFLKDKLQHGCLIAFDDWDCYYSDPKRGQKLAFSEFQDQMAGSHRFEELCDIPSGGKCFVSLELGKIGSEII
jgi:O-methyltransferase